MARHPIEDEIEALSITADLTVGITDREDVLRIYEQVKRVLAAINGTDPSKRVREVFGI